ncbi:hypothetical protein ACWGH3_21455 [Streptomyces sp. NPDC054884]|uniref:hypothetical protein n=1 Tax=Streptomyces sp. ME08-AFT2 TaxID=3028683 RepID=UPI0029B8A16D|nr:hypothetical protein [Streptomyces sp. ME08-AFT2]MDX3309977.1 hypothetical protein [Streptomyces sp. ME08-AFT2]
MLTVGAGITWAVTATRDTPPAAAAPLALTVQQDTGGGPATACAELDVTTLRQYTTAFEGTATSIDGDQITLRVDHWYRGEDASTGRLDNTHEGQLESFGQEFAVGQTYLVYAKDGKVPVCYSDSSRRSPSAPAFTEGLMRSGALQGGDVGGRRRGGRGAGVRGGAGGGCCRSAGRPR